MSAEKSILDQMSEWLGKSSVRRRKVTPRPDMRTKVKPISKICKCYRQKTEPRQENAYSVQECHKGQCGWNRIKQQKKGRGGQEPDHHRAFRISGNDLNGKILDDFSRGMMGSELCLERVVQGC